MEITDAQLQVLYDLLATQARELLQYSARCVQLEQELFHARSRLRAAARAVDAQQGSAMEHDGQGVHEKAAP